MPIDEGLRSRFSTNLEYVVCILEENELDVSISDKGGFLVKGEGREFYMDVVKQLRGEGVSVGFRTEDLEETSKEKDINVVAVAKINYKDTQINIAFVNEYKE